MEIYTEELLASLQGESRDELRCTMDVLIFDRSSDRLCKPGLTLQEGLPSVSLSVHPLLFPPVYRCPSRCPHPTRALPYPSSLFSDLWLLPFHIQVWTFPQRYATSKSQNINVFLMDSDSTDVPEHKYADKQPQKTHRRCLQGSLRQEFTGQLRANSPPGGARLRSRPPYLSVSFCSQTVHGKQRFTLCC